MGDYPRKIAKGILWIIWWGLKGSILVGIITKRIKDKKKRDLIVIAFDIAVILVFIWWAFNERYEYVQGYTDTLDTICSKYVLDFCPTWGKMKNMSLDDIAKYNTGTEFPNLSIKYPNISKGYCDSNGSGCFY
jgi:hypothetical protein